jgi:signal transduction histidine kinase
LIERLLDLAALESGHARLTSVDVDLAEITTAGVEAITPLAREHRITVDVHVPAGLTVPGDPGRLRQVVDSLLSNAVKFSPDDSTVTVTLAADGDLAVLTITDRGTGIPVAEQATMFRSLYRGRNAHQAGIPGAGLGLTLSRVLVERHHGTITLAPNQPTGTTVTVRFPRGQS